MFHLMFGIVAIVFLVIVLSILLFSIVTIVAGVFGGASTALFVKNKTFRNLLFIGFCILLFVGLLCLAPIVSIFASLSAAFFTMATITILVCIGMLSIAGIKFSNSIKNKIGKPVLIVIFFITLIVSISLAIFTLLASNFLLSA